MAQSESRPLKVLMLVDNGIVGDSRVQKSARAVADAGHEVHLVGLCVNGVPDTKPEIPGVTVHQVATTASFNQRKLSSIPKNPLYMLGYWDREATNRAQRRNAYRVAAVPVIRKSSATLGKAAKKIYNLTFKFHQFRLFIHRFALLHGSRNQTSALGKIRGRLTLIVRPHTAWKSLAPILKDLELSADGIIAQINPDVVHAHDFRALGPGARAALRRGGKKKVVIVYDAHEYLPGLTATPFVAQLGYENCESQYIKCADHVVTVSERIADLLIERHGLSERPRIVLNAPPLDSAATTSRNLRHECGINESTPLAVYLGGVSPLRGLDVVVEGLVEISDLHICFVSTMNPTLQAIVDDASARGVGDRLHVVDYVAPNEVVPYIESATVGLVPLLHTLNHHSALPSKFYEYACAQIPILGSDVYTVAKTLQDTKLGEVFVAGDRKDFAIKLKEMLADNQKYRDAYRNVDRSQFTWEAQVDTLQDLYAQISREFHGAS